MINEKKEYICYYLSELGNITFSSDGEHLTGLWLKGQKYYESTLKETVEEKEIPVFEQTKKWLDIYFTGKIPDFTPPLAPEGSEFRQKVWKILSEIPHGQVITYGDIARQMAKEQGKAAMSAQAVGGAVGHNPISIIIPCHRVVGSDGSLTGYAGGLDIKIKLLEIEQADMDKLYRPVKGTAL